MARSLPRLKDLSFRAFIDEFENLAEMQRMVVCDAIKHPGLRLAVHIAHKRDAVTDFKTSSDERIVEMHDLRKIDLEEQLSVENEFELLAAELFLLRLHLEGVSFGCPAFVPDKLHDQVHLPYRLSGGYRAAVVGRVRELLPRLTSTSIAQEVFRDEPLKRRLVDMIDKGLSRHSLKGKFNGASLIDAAKPRASIVLGALVNRSGDPPLGRDLRGAQPAACPERAGNQPLLDRPRGPGRPERRRFADPEGGAHVVGAL